MAKIIKSTKCWLARELSSLYTKHPLIAVRIETSWGTASAHKYFQTLLDKDREYRNGFSYESYSLIMNLFLVHISDYGEFDNPVLLARPNVNKESILEYMK